jgi:hypothetical protein
MSLVALQLLEQLLLVRVEGGAPSAAAGRLPLAVVVRVVVGATPSSSLGLNAKLN